MIHGLDVPDSLFLEPFADLKRGDDCGPSASRDGGDVRDVIAVAMGNENEISVDFFQIDSPSERILGNKRVEEQSLPCGGDSETSVSVIGKLHFVYVTTLCGDRNCGHEMGGDRSGAGAASRQGALPLILLD